MQASSIPSKIQLPFANSGTKNSIPVASQIGVTAGAASYMDGFPPLTFTPLASGGVPPAGADFNGILNAITAVQQWQSAGGVFRYDSAFSTAISGYPKGAILQSADEATLWLNLSDDNTTDPDATDGTAANWAPASSYGIATVTGLTNANVTLTPAQYSRPIITLAGTLTGNVQIVFPTSKQQWRVANNTTGSYTVTCKTASGTGATVVQGGQEIFYGDGTNLVQSVGNTPPVGDSSKRLATTEFCTGRLAGIQTFSSSGTYTRSVGVKSVIVEVIGAGGGGAGVPTSGTGTITTGGGGGAGGYALKRITSPGTTETVTVGAAGAGGAAGSNAGGNGGTTSFGAWVSATGGNGGATMGGAASNFVAAGGNGGAGSGGEVNYQGQSGVAGIGANPLAVGGTGGTSRFGGGGPGGGTVNSSAAGSTASSGAGAGGGGGATQGGAVQTTGGSGSSGLCIVYEYY